MQLHVADFLSATMHMTTKESGAYMLLLMVSHHDDAPLQKDHARLARIAGLSKASWLKISDTVLAMFEEIDGVLHPRQKQRWEQMARNENGRAPLARDVRQSVLLRDGEVCRYCGTTDGPWHIDHVHPVSRGGTDALENLAVACAPCNLSKGSKLLSVWLS